MSQHDTVSPEEAADRLAIRELVEAYAHCADRRDGLDEPLLRQGHSTRRSLEGLVRSVRRESSKIGLLHNVHAGLNAFRMFP
jgi:hypothetical protein